MRGRSYDTSLANREKRYKTNTQKIIRPCVWRMGMTSMHMTKRDNYWQGERVRLRPMCMDDIELWLAEERSDSEAVRFLNYGMTLPSSERDAQAFGERYAAFNNRDERIMFSIETLDGNLVGGMNIHSMNQKNGTFETGSRIYRRFRGQGYGFEAKIIVLRYAFHELRFQKYNIRCLATNQPMINHAKRLGCQPEGRIRRQIYTDGQYHDELFFGLTREEFDALARRLASQNDSEEQTDMDT